MGCIVGNIQSPTRMRTAYVGTFQQPIKDRKVPIEVPALLCKDCKSTSPIAAFIAVDALHMQCPQCLYVFFVDKTMLDKAMNETED